MGIHQLRTKKADVNICIARWANKRKCNVNIVRSKISVVVYQHRDEGVPPL